MGFSLKKFFKKVIKTAVGVGLTAVTGGALSSAAGFGRGLGKGLFGGGGADLGSKIGRNLSNLAKRAGGFLKSLFTRKANVPAPKSSIPSTRDTFDI